MKTIGPQNPRPFTHSAKRGTYDPTCRANTTSNARATMPIAILTNGIRPRCATTSDIVNSRAGAGARARAGVELDQAQLRPTPPKGGWGVKLITLNHQPEP